MDFNSLVIACGVDIFNDFLSWLSLVLSGKEALDTFKTALMKREKLDGLSVQMWSAFESIGWKILISRLRKKSLINSGKLWIQKNKYYTDHSKELADGFFHSFYQEKDCVCQYYKEIFNQVQKNLENYNEIGLNNNIFEDIFQGIEKEATDAWKKYLSDMASDYPQLREHLEEQKYVRLVRLIDGEKTPTVFWGADRHVLTHRIQGECFEQSILFPADNSQLLARAKAEEKLRGDWWDALYKKLDTAPLFLTGPGGMGKTAFLVYLYDSIKVGDTPFRGAFLLSLNTIMADATGKADFDGEPLCDPDRSVLLNHIASRAGNPKHCRGWKQFFKDGKCDWPGQKPILLLLDGFNEMHPSNTEKLNWQNQIIQEIRALANREEYPYIRLLVTTRADSDLQAERQLKKLSDCFQMASLGGIKEAFPLAHLLNDDMKKLLERPMYYRYLIKNCREGSVPSTQYELLKEMYQALYQQSVNNTGDQTHKLFQWCVMKYLMPMLAYTQWSTNHLTDQDISFACVEFVKWSRMFTHDHENERTIVLEQVRHLGKQEGEVEDYLTKQEQVLFLSDGEYSFQHQDYRDYLVAAYFLQRLDFMGEETAFNLWKDGQVLDSLRLNSYSVDILRLIYQAVSFEQKPEEGKKTAFVCNFFRWKTLKDEQVDGGHILWYTTIYQLVDMRKLVGVSYGGDNLENDAIYLLTPLVQYVCQRPKGKLHCQKLSKLEGLLQQNLIEILMKACEIYRRNGQYTKVREITSAAREIYTFEGGTQNYGILYSVIEHNDAMAELYSFAESGHGEELKIALKKFRTCVEDKHPYRYSCNALAMMLVSPHPKLKDRPEYLDFVKKFTEGSFPEVFAFWLYYVAIFEFRKTGESWSPRLYSLSRFLYLLADNRVQVVGLSREEIETLEVESLEDLDPRCIGNTGDEAPIPTKLNLTMISCFLKKIKDIDIGWKHYMQGLIYYFLENNAYKARLEFEKVDSKDVRAQLWKAYLNNERQHLIQIYEQSRPSESAVPKELERYSPATYYDRDIGRLANALYEYEPKPY